MFLKNKQKQKTKNKTPVDSINKRTNFLSYYPKVGGGHCHLDRDFSYIFI